MELAQIINALVLLAAALFGASIGSFLNVVIYRIPRGLSVNEPRRSFCPKCEAAIPVWCNIPVLSWLALGGKCRSCKAGISIRYPLVEALVAGGFVACFLLFPIPQAIVLSLFFAVLVAATFIDFDFFIIPHEVNAVGLAVGLVGSALVPALHGEELWWRGLLMALAGAALGFVLLWLVVELGKRLLGRRKLAFEAGEQWRLHQPDPEEPPVFEVGGEEVSWWEIFTRKSDRLIVQSRGLNVDGEERVKGGDDGAIELRFDEGGVTLEGGERIELEGADEFSGVADAVVVPREAMGFGDVLFLLMIGAFVGPAGVLFTIFASSVIGSVVGITLRITGKLGGGGRIPFGPYLALGAVLWLTIGPAALAWYLGLVGW